jgi:hypothetical protein
MGAAVAGVCACSLLSISSVFFGENDACCCFDFVRWSCMIGGKFESVVSSKPFSVLVHVGCLLVCVCGREKRREESVVDFFFCFFLRQLRCVRTCMLLTDFGILLTGCEHHQSGSR